MISKIVSTPWHFMRWLRLGISLYFILVSIQRHELMIGIFGALFLFQALFDVGCCGIQNCNVPTQKSSSPLIKDINYEEIKQEKNKD